ncbi:MAG: toll/interleukin-1 receptor domain-containing protein [Nitrosomonas oligotropha]|uniref:Toll/interleukin-1 receptor domain-containing protein n=1 Tax=Nitrosomonas oligotropha TaxID=42354 RepID=A0A5C7VTK5_9PROT|nr:MAG: toll/interleukin-1 receptor domain-containing protein [Nitrosomonas oligotropha]
MTDNPFDAFLSHHGTDKPAVERIAAALHRQGLSCFLDKWDIAPGDEWLRNLEQGLRDSRFIVIFFGPDGIGPYQQAEADAALRRQIQQRQHCVIPVLLPGATPEHIAQCSVFLQGVNALRFHDLNDPLPHRLLAGLLRGEDPEHLRQLIRDKAQAPADLLQTLQSWLSGLSIGWQDDECIISQGQGQRCLNIPDLSASFNAASIEYLLSWKSRLTGLIGREQELQTLHAWTDAPQQISCCLITGEGGTGKTRLAFEFARQLRESKGWQAGEAQGLSGSWYTGGAGTLIVIDYPEQRPDKVRALLEALARQPPTCKLRVLLLGRNGDFLQQLTQTAQTIIAPGFELTGLADGANTNADAWQLFQEAWKQLHQRQQRAAPPLPLTQAAFHQWQQRHATHQRPLFVLALAVHGLQQSGAHELNAPEILRALVQQYEINRLIKEAKQTQLDPHCLVMLRALAAIAGKLPGEALRQLIQTSETLPLDIRLPALNQLKQTSLWLDGGIPALQPDLLAADLLHHALTEIADDQAGAWQYCALAAAPDQSEASSILGRLIHDAQFILQRSWPLQALIDWVIQDDERSTLIDAALRRNNLERTLLPLAVATGQKAVQAHEQLAQDNFAAYGPALAASLNSWSVDLAENGQRAQALDASGCAVNIHEQLAQENFAAYGPNLALSLNNWSNRLAEDGQRAQALDAIGRAVAIYEQLAQENFAAYSPALAMSLNNWSNRLAEDGQRAKALDAIGCAVNIREQLAQANFAAYGPALAQSLHNWSIYLAEDGQRAQALDAIGRAVAIYEQLAQDNFAAYGPALAQSLNNWSVYLAANGQRAQALDAIGRAVNIHEQLAQANFAAYSPALAMSLNNWSIRLAEDGQRAQALDAIGRAVNIHEQLAQDNFAAYGPALAQSLNNWSVYLAEDGQHEKALDAIGRAVNIREQLAQENFAAYGPALAQSLNNWSLRLAEDGQRAKALDAIGRAVNIHEQLAQANFAAYGADLAVSLNNWSLCLAENGQRAQALNASGRAVNIHEQLAQENFTAYGPDLASSLNNWSIHLAEDGQRAKALDAIGRAVNIHEQLAQANFAAYGADLAQSLNNWSADLARDGQRAQALDAIERAVAIHEQLAQENFAAYGPDLAMSLNNWSDILAESAALTAEEAKQLRDIRARLRQIKRRVRDEGVQVPAHFAGLFESGEPDDDD